MSELLTSIERIYQLSPFVFVAVLSYSFACPFAISWVRALRLDRKATNKPPLTRLELRTIAFAIAAPVTLAIAYYGFNRALSEAVVHALISGGATPMVARFYIAHLEKQNPEAAELFKVGRHPRRQDDPPTANYADPQSRDLDDTQEL